MIQVYAGRYDLVTRCTVCQDVIARETVTTEMLPHTPVIVPAVAPTCTKEGSTAGSSCAVCNTELTPIKTLAKIGHADNNGDQRCDMCGKDMRDRCDWCGKYHTGLGGTITAFFHRILYLLARVFGAR